MTSAQRFVRRRFDPAGRYGRRLTVFGLGALLLALPFAWIVVNVVQDGDLTRFDREFATVIRREARAFPVLVAMAKALSWLGKPIWFYGLIAVVAVVLWRKRLYRLLTFALATPIIGGAIDVAVKTLVNRERPTGAADYIRAIGRSFPSGHAMMSTVVYGTLLLVALPAVRRRYRWMLAVATLLLVLSIGMSRLVLGVHFLSDVLGGWTLGIAWLALSTAAFSTWRQERGKRPVHVTEGVEPESAAKLRRT